MWDDLVELMADGVRTGRIDTVRPEHRPRPWAGRRARTTTAGEVYVYRRTGEPCLVCGTAVRTAELAGRATCSGARAASPRSARAPQADLTTRPATTTRREDRTTP